jgi:MFS family permease
LFINTLYLQDVRHYSALGAGLLTVPMALTLFIFARISGRLLAMRGPRLPLALAGLPLAAGALLLARSTTHTSVLYLIACYLIFGVGCGLVNAPISNTAMSGMPLDQSGVAGAVASTSRQVGSSLGVAVTGSIIAAGFGATFISASHVAWLVVAGCGVTVCLLGLFSTSDWAQGTAQRNAVRLAQEPKEGVR